MAIICGLLAGLFVLGVYHGAKHPPTQEETERARENRKKTAVFIGTATASTCYNLVKKKDK